jgi:hypothetical protein
MTHLKTTFAAIALCCSTSAFAQLQLNQSRIQQPTIASQLPQLERAETIKLDAIKKKYDDRIKVALEKEPALKKAIDASLTAIANETDRVKRKSLIAIHEKRFGAQYEAVLKTAQIDTNGMIREMSGAVPRMSFTKASPFVIRGDFKNLTLAPPSSTSTPTPTPPPSQPTNRSIRTLSNSNFETSKSASCQIGIGSDHSGSGMNNSASAGTVATGGCEAKIKSTLVFTLARGEVAQVNLNYDLIAETDAIGLGLAADADSRASLSILTSGAVMLPGARNTFRGVGSSSLVLIGGAASDDSALENISASATYTGPGTITIEHEALADTNSIGIAVGTLGKARVKINSGSILVGTSE